MGGLAASSGRYVFGVRDGGRVSRTNARRDIGVMCKALGITAAVNPHPFRHVFAVNYISAGGDIYRLSRILRHSSVTTTQTYLRSMASSTWERGITRH